MLSFVRTRDKRKVCSFSRACSFEFVYAYDEPSKVGLDHTRCIFTLALLVAFFVHVDEGAADVRRVWGGPRWQGTTTNPHVPDYPVPSLQ
jgi:hypothetical protein